jgi:hypothetical protein
MIMGMYSFFAKNRFADVVVRWQDDEGERAVRVAELKRPFALSHRYIYLACTYMFEYILHIYIYIYVYTQSAMASWKSSKNYA